MSRTDINREDIINESQIKGEAIASDTERSEIGSDGEPFDRRLINKITAVVFAVIAAFFITDTVRIKAFGIPPIFCIRAVEYADGTSAEYYGAGYKIKRDHDINENTDEYSVTLWILPDFISL